MSRDPCSAKRSDEIGVIRRLKLAVMVRICLPLRYGRSMLVRNLSHARTPGTFFGMWTMSRYAARRNYYCLRRCLSKTAGGTAVGCCSRALSHSLSFSLSLYHCLCVRQSPRSPLAVIVSVHSTASDDCGSPVCRFVCMSVCQAQIVDALHIIILNPSSTRADSL